MIYKLKTLNPLFGGVIVVVRPPIVVRLYDNQCAVMNDPFMTNTTIEQIRQFIRLVIRICLFHIYTTTLTHHCNRKIARALCLFGHFARLICS